MYSRSVGCDDTCILVCTIAYGPEGSPTWYQGSREGGCEFVVEDVRDTSDCVGNAAVRFLDLKQNSYHLLTSQ